MGEKMNDPVRTKLACNHEFVQYGNHCKHGQLERQCEICELEKEVESLKCCGNCKWFHGFKGFCSYEPAPMAMNMRWNDCCPNQWQSDGMTRNKRVDNFTLDHKTKAVTKL